MGQAGHVSITRRSLLADVVSLSATASGSAVLLAGAAGADPMGRHPDAVLLQLAADLDRAWAAETALDEAMAGRSTVDDEPAREAVHESASSIVRQIQGVPARTMDGLKVKARAVSWCYGGEAIDCKDEGFAAADRVMASMVNDLLRM